MLALYLAREIARIILLFRDYSDRYIEKILPTTHQTIGRLRRKLIELDVEWKDIKNLTDSEFQQLLYPKVKRRLPQKVAPPFEEIQKEFLKKKGKRRKSLRVFHDEHVLKFGKLAYKRSRFNELVRQYLISHDVVMKQVYTPGEIIFIDYAGTRLHYIENGVQKYVNVFVGCLGFSKKLFAIATCDMTARSWILALVRALEYFAGVPEVIQFDNAKAMVSQAKKIALLNENARVFAEHYGCLCDTSRVASPKDNANAEAAVKFITQRILVVMNSDFTFFSLSELNAHLIREVEKLNEQPYQKREETRNQLFTSEEKKAMKPLPCRPLIPFLIQKNMKVPSTYLLPYQGHEYSVPYILVGKEVTVRITDSSLIAFYDGRQVAEHPLSDKRFGFTRLKSHMKPSHLAEEGKSKDTFMAWASGIGKDVEQIIEKQYERTSNSKSRVVGKHCGELQKLCDKCGQEVFSKACQYAIERNWYEPDEIGLIIRTRAWEQSIEPNHIEHDNIRGREYYQGGRYE